MSELRKPAEVAAHYGKSIHTIKYWRQIGYGPAFIRVSPRADGKGEVRYPVESIEAFDAELAGEPLKRSASRGTSGRARLSAATLPRSA